MIQPGAAIIGTTRLPARGSGFHHLGASVIAALRWSAEARALALTVPEVGLRGCWLPEGSRVVLSPLRCLGIEEQRSTGGGSVLSVRLGEGRGAVAPKQE